MSVKTRRDSHILIIKQKSKIPELKSINMFEVSKIRSLHSMMPKQAIQHLCHQKADAITKIDYREGEKLNETHSKLGKHITNNK